ncbi:MAG: uracil-DNA glycosylase [Bacteroidota bacterium]
MTIKMEESWKEQLKEEFKKPYFLQLVDHLKAEKALNRQIYPAGNNIFKAFEKTPFDQVKLVILGQDPYHGPNQAHGLSFSVQDGVAIPRSLKNIFKELQSDIGISIPTSGNLTAWAEKGVLLLNASLTVRADEPASHAQIGWLTFTDAVISTLSANKKDLVFLLWGKFAQEKQLLIDGNKHFVLKAAHPSPFSAEKGFFGCKHFSKSNEYLMQKGFDPIDWKL